MRNRKFNWCGLIQKSTGWDHTFLSIFFFFFLGMSRAGVNTKDAMKKQIR